MSFRIGDKVVCVDDDFSMFQQFSNRVSEWPRRGVVYIVRETEDMPAFLIWPAELGIRLLGIIGLPHPFTGTEQAFRASRFRLVSEVGHPPIQLSRDCTVDSGPGVG